MLAIGLEVARSESSGPLFWYVFLIAIPGARIEFLLSTRVQTGMFQTEPPSTKMMEGVRQQAADFMGVKLDECTLMPSTTVSFK